MHCKRTYLTGCIFMWSTDIIFTDGVRHVCLNREECRSVDECRYCWSCQCFGIIYHPLPGYWITLAVQFNQHPTNLRLEAAIGYTPCLHRSTRSSANSRRESWVSSGWASTQLKRRRWLPVRLLRIDCQVSCEETLPWKEAITIAIKQRTLIPNPVEQRPSFLSAAFRSIFWRLKNSCFCRGDVAI